MKPSETIGTVLHTVYSAIQDGTVNRNASLTSFTWTFCFFSCVVLHHIRNYSKWPK